MTESVQTSSIPTAPPIAKRVPAERLTHGHLVMDEYAWMRNRDDDPDVIAYLEAENAWTKAQMAHTAKRQEALFEEIRARIQETDLSVPVRKGDWWYYSRTVEGMQYAIHCRKPAFDKGERRDVEPGNDVAEQVMLDQNVLAGDSEFFALGAFDLSPKDDLLAYSTDTTGGEVYTMAFRNLDTGKDLADQIPGTYYGTAWGNDNTTFFYVKPDEAMRPYQLWRHSLGTPVTDDVLVYEEPDERFYLGVGTTKDEHYLVLHLGSKMTDECRLLSADEPTGEFQLVEARQQGVEYGVEHHGDRFFIVTNADGAENFKLMEAPDTAPSRSNWTEVIAHRPDVHLSGIDVFANYLVLFERAGGLRHIRVRSLVGNDDYVIDQPEEVSTASGGSNPEFDSTMLRYGYTSMITPSSVFDYNLITRERTLRKQQPVLGDYDLSLYVTTRIWATADDGTEIPMSVVYRKDNDADTGRPSGPRPALLYGYGSYEASMDPGFSSIRLSLLDRGFVYAIAHIRGGGEMGRQWYLRGKFLDKRNTFTDFIACARHLTHEGWTTTDQLVIRGGSAGGLLMGAVANMAPEQFGVIIAEVPFVDALNTILDPSLPLTVMEWEEWGNPVESSQYYDYMSSYSPYENVETQDYPAMLVTAGLNDPRVSYWEPAKWVAKLRTTRTDTNRLLLKTEMGAGHMGPSGRYDAWKDEAFVLAFIFDTLGID